MKWTFRLPYAEVPVVSSKLAVTSQLSIVPIPPPGTATMGRVSVTPGMTMSAVGMAVGSAGAVEQAAISSAVTRVANIAAAFLP